MHYRKWRRFISIAAVTLAYHAAAYAQVTPVIFERAPIRIDPIAVVAVKEGETAPVRSVSAYDVEVRSEDALKLEYIHTLNTLTDDTGVAIVFSAPTLVSLPYMQVFTPVDALFVAEYGTILQILPNVVLGEMQQEIMAKEPVRAFVFLKAGEVAARQILPRDLIAGSMFTPAPPVMQ